MHRIFLIVCACLPLVAAAQNFNPHSSDSTSNKEVPQGLYVWTVDRHFGDIRRAEPDTLPHLYPQSTLGMGRYGEYNTVGSNYTARQNRIFTDRKETSSFLFTDAYDQSLRRPDEWHFTNTLSPITNLGYDNCGDKTNGEDHINAFFAVNAGKQTGLGFNLDYQYARGYFQNQNVSHFGATVYVSHLGDRYQVHALYTNNHQKAAENGGIVNDDYITHPELFTESYSENEIPTVLDRNWNRNNSQHFFLTHRYSLGFYRKVSMTEEEKKARVFAIQSQKEKAARNSSEQSEKKGLARRDLGELKPEIGQGRDGVPEALPDSLMAQTDMPTDSIDQWMKNEYVPVTSFIHTLEANIYDRIYQAYKTPKGLYADTLYDVCANGKYSGDSIYDQTKMLQLRNTVAIALLEGFNKYAPAGLKAFASYEVRRYDMPDLLPSTLDSQPSTLNRWTEHYVSLGGQLQKTQGRTLHYNLLAETWVAGEDVGALRLDATADLNFPLFGDTVTLAAKGWLHRMKPTFYQRHYHSKHLWWDNDFSRETRTHIEGSLTLPRTKTSLRVAVDEIQHYIYLGMDYTRNGEKRTALTANFHQHSGNLSVLTAQVEQPLRLGPLHWNNILTYQSSSNKDVLPLPTLNVFSNLYLQFMVAHVLRVELGASATWFTKYYAPDYLPQLNSFAVQQNADSRIELGNFPFIDVYANLHLKHARFFVMMANATATSFNRQAFLAPHYPLNRAVLHMGVSWNFFN